MLIPTLHKAWAIILGLLVLCSSCSVSTISPDVVLEIKTVQQTGHPGVYNLSGSTNLPDQSQVTVAAVRYLNLPDQQLLSDSNANYSILSRRTVEASQGKWQTTLNLWQVASDGRFQEVWQLETPIELLHPDTKVTFLATFDPSGQFHTSHQQQLQLKGQLVRFTADGQEYVQASQTLPIALPTGSTTLRGPQSELNSGWGNRSLFAQPKSLRDYIMPPAKTTQTDAPLPPGQFLR